MIVPFVGARLLQTRSMGAFPWSSIKWPTPAPKLAVGVGYSYVSLSRAHTSRRPKQRRSHLLRIDIPGRL